MAVAIFGSLCLRQRIHHGDVVVTSYGAVFVMTMFQPHGGGLPGWQREMTCMTMYDKYLRRLHLGR